MQEEKVIFHQPNSSTFLMTVLQAAALNSKKKQEEMWAKQRMDANILRKRISEQRNKTDDSAAKIPPVSALPLVYLAFDLLPG